MQVFALWGLAAELGTGLCWTFIGGMKGFGSHYAVKCTPYKFLKRLCMTSIYVRKSLQATLTVLF